MTHDEMIAVIAAHKYGKKIQCSNKGGMSTGKTTVWQTVEVPLWNFQNFNFRIKPEPLTISDCWDKAMDTSSISADGVLVEFLKLAKENGHV